MSVTAVCSQCGLPLEHAYASSCPRCASEVTSLPSRSRSAKLGRRQGFPCLDCERCSSLCSSVGRGIPLSGYRLVLDWRATCFRIEHSAGYGNARGDTHCARGDHSRLLLVGGHGWRNDGRSGRHLGGNGTPSSSRFMQSRSR